MTLKQEIANKRPRASCQIYAWKVTAKHTYNLSLWIFTSSLQIGTLRKNTNRTEQNHEVRWEIKQHRVKRKQNYAVVHIACNLKKKSIKKIRIQTHNIMLNTFKFHLNMHFDQASMEIWKIRVTSLCILLPKSNGICASIFMTLTRTRERTHTDSH